MSSLTLPRRMWPLLALALAGASFLEDGESLVSLTRSWPAVSPEPPAERISVLFILTDQHTTRAMGAYTNGFGGVSSSLTPQLDQLAAEGVKFDRAFCTTAQCCPSRFTFLTGLAPRQHGLRMNNVWEPRDEVTFPELAREQGYVTATFGKHHMFWLEQAAPLTEDHGFDLIVDRADYDDYCAANGVRQYDAPGQYVPLKGLPPQLSKTGYTKSPNAFHPAGYWADRTIQFLEERAGPQGDGRPFVAWYSMIGPHTPMLPSGLAAPVDWAHLYAPAALGLPPNLGKLPTTTRLATQQALFAGITPVQWREVLACYYGLTTQIDWNIGRVLKRLDELDLRARTLVVYTSDHGEMGAEMATWTKGTGSYDAIARVPLLLRLPGVTAAGKVSGELVGGVDLFPTLAEVTGVFVPDELRARLEGRSLLDLARPGPPPPGWRQVVFNEFGIAGLPGTGRSRMARTKSAKYSLDELNGMEHEFYELATDPYEQVDRYSDPSPEIQGQIAFLKSELNAWWGDEGTHAPNYLITGDGKKKPPRVQFPSPAAGATDVPRDVDLGWLPSTSADTQEVFFGTQPEALPQVLTLAAMEARFNPGTLAPGTTYYWRVDSANSNGAGPGTTWSFTTELGGAGGPGLAAGPQPAQHAADVALEAVLAWTPPRDASTQDLWFGAPGELQLVASALAGTVQSFDPGPLSAGAAYTWRVDTSSAAGLTEGTVWAFETDPAGLPQRASSPMPRHLEVGVGAQHVLRWLPGADTVEHDVWIGTEFPLTFAGTTTAASFASGPLTPGASYHWRVDSRNASGTLRGATWRFDVAE